MSREIIIIYKDKLEKILYQIKDKKAPKLHISSVATLSLSLLIAGLSTKEFNSAPLINLSGESIKLIIWIVFAISLLVLLVLIVKYFYLRSDGYKSNIDFDEIKEQLINNSEFKEDNTLILLFPQKENGVLQFPVQQKVRGGIVTSFHILMIFMTRMILERTRNKLKKRLPINIIYQQKSKLIIYIN